MTYPTFNAGQILTSTEMNAVGLWLVKSQTIGTAVSSVTVTGAFSADYDNYKIVLSGGVGSTSSSLGLRLSASATGYYGGLIYGSYSGTTVNFGGTFNGPSFAFAGVGTTNSLTGNIELLNPFATKTTGINNPYVDSATAGAAGFHSGFHNSATSHTAFTILVGSGTITGGTIKVYGYRN
jgi:hypothetical protein